MKYINKNSVILDRVRCYTTIKHLLLFDQTFNNLFALLQLVVERIFDPLFLLSHDLHLYLTALQLPHQLLVIFLAAFLANETMLHILFGLLVFSDQNLVH